MKNKNLGICSRCKKNKATITYAESMTDFTHGFSQKICSECYDEIKHKNTWYQDGRKEMMEEIEKIFNIWFNELNAVISPAVTINDSAKRRFKQNLQKLKDEK